MTDDLGKQQQIQAQYVIGCEGARSVVRDAIGARYEGIEASRPNFNIVFRASGLGEPGAARTGHPLLGVES